MAAPKIFISSTCYDLKYIRENLKYFINNLGYESVLSEDGDIFYNPDEHTHNACLNEVSNCQIFVLIIGGRYGGRYIREEKSITNKEYEEALRLKIPIYTLVEQSVLNEHFVYQQNKNNADSIVYPSVDDIKIFGFIDEVRKNSYNNAIFPFSDYHDIEAYLKKQWAGMTYNFLVNSIETKKVAELFEEIHNATEKIEYYTKQLALNVGDQYTKALIECYDAMLGNEAIQDLTSHWGINVTPHKIIRIDNIDEICDYNIAVEDIDGIFLSPGGPPYECSRGRYDIQTYMYEEIRNKLFEILKNNNISVDDFLNHESDN